MYTVVFLVYICTYLPVHVLTIRIYNEYTAPCFSYNSWVSSPTLLPTQCTMPIYVRSDDYPPINPLPLVIIILLNSST
jgi:hypothetical protein